MKLDANSFQRVCDVLQFWKILEFTAQVDEKAKSSLKDSGDGGKTQGSNDGKSAAGSKGRKTAKGPKGSKCDEDSEPRFAEVKKRVRKPIFQNEGAAVCSFDTRPIPLYAEEVFGRGKLCFPGGMVVTLGLIQRERCLAKLESVLPKAARRGEPLEREDGTLIALGQIEVLESGAYKNGSFRLSPLVWLLMASRKRRDFNWMELDDLVKKLKSDSAQIEEEAVSDLAERDPQLTALSIARIVDSVVNWLNSRAGNALLEVRENQDGKKGWASAPSGAGSTDDEGKGDEAPLDVVPEFFLRARLYESEDDRSDGQESFSPSFWFSHYYTDLELVQSRFAHLAAGKEAPTDQEISLARFVLAADAKQDEEPSRFDVLHVADDSEKARGDSYRFYLSALSPKRTPLGRWPSPYKPALSQQLAVNLFMSSLTEQVRSRGACAAKQGGNGAASGIGQGRDLRSEPWEDIDVPTFFSVNGPPGTGKTTMLKDVVAACVVEKARILARYDTPDDAFEETILPVAKERGWDLVCKCYFLKDGDAGHARDAARYGILVCSSNNTAVENISKELPKTDSVEKGTPGARIPFIGKDPDTFLRGQAQLLLEDQNRREGKKASPDSVWGFVSVPLGKSENRASLVKRVLGKDVEGGTNLAVFKNNNGYWKELLARYASSRKRFRSLLGKVEAMRAELSAASERVAACCDAVESWGGMAGIDARIENAEGKLAKAEDEVEAEQQKLLDLIPDHLQAYYKEGGLERLDKRVDDQLKDARRTEEAASEFCSSMINKIVKRFSKHLESRFDQQREKADEARKEIDRLSNMRDEVYHQKAAVEEARNAVIGWRNAVQEARDAKQALLDAWDGAEAAAKERGATAFSPELADGLLSDDPAKRNKAYTSYAWLDDEYDAMREDLFAAAYDMICCFVCASRNMRKNLRLLCDMWGVPDIKQRSDMNNRKKNKEVIRFDDKDRLVAMPALMETLMLAVPVISSTFASVQTMLADVKKPGSLGVLVIDEAGQSVPSQAVGALFRCSRALVVGDPKQVEPVITDDVRVVERLFGEGFENYQHPQRVPVDSTQSFVDAGNPLGSWIKMKALKQEGGGEEKSAAEWVGAPLLVHRRCVSPMFDIANELSYGDVMSKETSGPSPAVVKSFCLPSSFWLDVRGAESGNKDHFVPNQAEAITPYLQSAFQNAPNGAGPNLFLVSPFKTVVEGLKKFVLKKREQLGWKGDKKGLQAWCKAHIGTVHVFQGKEANEVMFVLGCDKNALGAVRWVTANIVNVAVTRAKYRFVAVGDERVWCGDGGNAFVSFMKEKLDSWWVDYLPKDGEGIDKVFAQHPELIPRVEYMTSRGADDEGEAREGDESDEASEGLRLRGDYVKRLASGPAALFSKTLEEKDYQAIGFSSMQEFLECCDDEEMRAMLQIGIWFYVNGGLADDYADLSEGANVVFAREACSHACLVAEYCARDRLVAGLKRLLPDYLISTSKRLADAAPEKFSLGVIAKIIGRKDSIRVLANATSGADAAYDEAWWHNASKLLHDVANGRNPSAHPDRVDVEACKRTAERAVGKARGEADEPPFGIIRERKVKRLLDDRSAR